MSSKIHWEYSFVKYRSALPIATFFCLFLFAGEVHPQKKIQKRPPPVYEDHDGYEVLSVVLNARSLKWKNETVRIDPRTAPSKSVAEIKAQCSGIPTEFQSASEDFDKNVKTRLLPRKEFSLNKKYNLGYASPSVAGQSPRSGTYYVAAVGFNDTKTRAIAFVEYICGSLCGNSMFYFLRKSEKGWQEAQEVQREVRACGRIY